MTDAASVAERSGVCAGGGAVVAQPALSDNKSRPIHFGLLYMASHPRCADECYQDGIRGERTMDPRARRFGCGDHERIMPRVGLIRRRALGFELVRIYYGV